MLSDLNAVFNHYFELLHANTDALREDVFRLRYQVYVVETGFERPEEHPGGLERDAFDPRSDHYLLRHRSTGVFAGTARMVLPDPEDPLRKFPIEEHCRFYDENAFKEPVSRKHIGEVSRFAIAKSFKKRPSESGTLIGVSERTPIQFEDDERRILPHLSVGLFAVEMRMMHQHGLTHCYAVMEPPLHRFILRFGLLLHQNGPEVDYHGQRIPCLGAVSEFLPNIKRTARPVWELMTDGGRYTCGTE